MDMVIACIKKPLDKFTSIQKQIANEVRSIGGSGNIHGSIIDIDYYNHIYVNPIDLTVTGYWAMDIIHKIIFPSISRPLEAKCPILYANYAKLINENTKTFILSGDIEQEAGILPQIYLNTDIYRASREIKKMQKLNVNILSVWHEPG